jgi:IS4 transposase
VAPLVDCHRMGLVRADAGFCANAVVTHFEACSLNYIVAGRLLPGLRLLLPGLTAWTAVERGLAVTEVLYHAQGWPPTRDGSWWGGKKKSSGPRQQGKLLKDVPGYRYQLFVTNLTLPPVEVWRLYRHRVDSENRIAELKQDFGLTGFCLDSFWGTEAAFSTVVLAYNLYEFIPPSLATSPQGREAFDHAGPLLG